MSLINQVLSQLERRGVHVEQEQDMVRAVPRPRSGGGLRMFLLLLLASLAVWWWQGRDTAVSSAKPHAQQVAVSVAPKPPSGVASEDRIASRSGVAAASAVSAVVPVSTVAAVAVSAAKPVQIASQSVLPPKAAVSAPAPKVVASAVQAKPSGKPREAVVAQPMIRAPKPAAPKAGATASPMSAASQAAAKPPAAPAKQAVAPNPRSKPQVTAPVAETGGMPMKQVSRAQQAETEFRKGSEAMKQGRSSEAIASYQMALQLDGAHDGARQSLVVLLLEDKRGSDAERLLQERLENRPEHTGFAMLLARLQVERGATGEALVTLERSLAYAEARADYLAFLAALQQRNSLHADAATHYQAALKLQPGNGTWLMGYGISLQALRRTEEAKAAYRQALESKSLSPDLKVFVQRKLNGL